MLNKQLQGKAFKYLKWKEAIIAFLGRLRLFVIGHKDLLHFPNVATVEDLHKDDILIYIDHLKNNFTMMWK